MQADATTQPSNSPPPYSRPATAGIVPVSYVRSDAAHINVRSPTSPSIPSSSQPGSSRSVTSLSPAAPSIQPCNYLAIARTHEDIKGSFVLDPTLRIPPAVLPPLTDDEEADGVGEAGRRNMRLEQTHGHIDAEVWVVDGGRGAEEVNAYGWGDVKRDLSAEAVRKRVKIDVKARHAGAKFKLRKEGSHPIRLCTTAYHSTLALYLPRTFTGPLKLTSSHSPFTTSPALTPHITTFSDFNGVRQCFVGDYRASTGDLGEWTGKEEDWAGDVLTISATHSRVKLYFVDEQKEESSGPGFMGKLFSWK